MAAEDVIRTLIEWGARVGIDTVYRAGGTLAACLSIRPCSCQGGLSGLVGLPELVRGRAG